MLHDPRALDIIGALNYDFAKWEGGRSLAGAVLRARMFDRYAESFLQEYPHGTVVELGCGLDTRFERLNNGEVRWFDLDLPNVIALRQRFFDDTPRRTMIAASLLDSAWMDQVEDAGGPWMFIAEAVLIYFDAPEVRCALGEPYPTLPRRAHRLRHHRGQDGRHLGIARRHAAPAARELISLALRRPARDRAAFVFRDVLRR